MIPPTPLKRGKTETAWRYQWECTLCGLHLPASPEGSHDFEALRDEAVLHWINCVGRAAGGVQ